MIREAVGDIRLAGAAEADQIGRDAARDRRNMRDDVAPDIRGGRVAMQEQDDRAACTCRHIGHGGVENVDVVAR